MLSRYENNLLILKRSDEAQGGQKYNAFGAKTFTHLLPGHCPCRPPLVWPTRQMDTQRGVLFWMRQGTISDSGHKHSAALAWMPSALVEVLFVLALVLRWDASFSASLMLEHLLKSVQYLQHLCSV